jgi:hypothetical protein
MIKYQDSKSELVLDRLWARAKEATRDRIVLASPDRLARNYVHQTA